MTALADHLVEAAAAAGALAELAAALDRKLPPGPQSARGRSAPRKGADHMGRSKGGARVRGPHKHGRRWRLIVVGADGSTRLESLATRTAAEQRKREIEQEQGSVTVDAALVEYREHLARKGNRARSIETTIGRLSAWVPNGGGLLARLRGDDLRRRYESRRVAVAVDTVRNELAEVRTWLRWCGTRGWLGASPADGIVAEGRRRRGKPQLHADEARRLSAAAEAAARAGRDSGLGALLALWCGLRAGEVCGLRTRDVDRVGGGRVWIWVAEQGGKTAAARRRVEAGGALAELLLAQAARSENSGSGWLFPAASGSGHRERTWLRKAVARLCDRAGVPRVPPHGLRGTYATLARGAGIGARAVADALGHEETTTTERHYVAPGAGEAAEARAAQEVLNG